MFNFDEFINKPCLAIFGRPILFIPAKSEFAAFEINGDFHENYKDIGFDKVEAAIASAQIVVFIRDADMPGYYPKAYQGDSIKIDERNYQIIDIQLHIPGSKKLILHESS